VVVQNCTLELRRLDLRSLSTEGRVRMTPIGNSEDVRGMIFNDKRRYSVDFTGN
jgi:hypothetical protein